MNNFIYTISQKGLTKVHFSVFQKLQKLLFSSDDFKSTKVCNKHWVNQTSKQFIRFFLAKVKSENVAIWRCVRKQLCLLNRSEHAQHTFP